MTPVHPRLVARAQPGPVVAVEVLVEEQMVPPVSIGLELLRTSIHGTPTPIVSQEDPGQPLDDLAGHLEQRHHAS